MCEVKSQGFTVLSYKGISSPINGKYDHDADGGDDGPMEFSAKTESRKARQLPC